MPTGRDTLEQKQTQAGCDARELSQLERELETVDNYLDFLANLMNQMEQRLSPVLSPAYFEDLGKPYPVEENTSKSVSPLISELNRYNRRVLSTNERLSMIMEYLEI